MAEQSYRPAVVIPYYNHPATIGGMVQAVLAHVDTCIVVDDGSDVQGKAALAEVARAEPERVRVVTLPRNEGKGGAVMSGLREAARLGFTHALQIDADGQHVPADIPRFLEQSRAAPAAIICGVPVYDDSVPTIRLLGRYLTHVCVWINTLSFTVRDSMCGFRAYPLPPVMALIDSVEIGRRMDFDTEIMVRLVWRGVPVINQPTRVTYPESGVSHFRLFHDNLLITGMHVRLFAGMLLRLPLLLWRKVRQP